MADFIDSSESENEQLLPTNQEILDIYFGDTSESDFSAFDEEENNSTESESDDADTIPANTWTRNVTCTRVGQFLAESGPKLPRTFPVDTSTPVDFFKLLMPPTIYDNIAKETNSYAELCQQEKDKRDEKWKTTTAEEIKAYIGINVMFGVNPRHEYSDYWSDNPFLACEGIKRVMTLNRYEKLCQYLHCNCDVARVTHRDPNYHPGARVSPVEKVLSANIVKYYQHSPQICIDEAMKAFRGRSDMRQYMSNKPDKWGLKYWCRCDGVTSYLSKFQLYTGKRDRTPVQDQYGLGYRVVHELTRDVVDKNHQLFVDRYFSSVRLVEDLYKDKIYTCGTIQNNRKGLPLEIKVKKNVLKKRIPNRGDSLSFQHGPTTVTAWNDNNIVVVIHNNMPNPMESTTCQRQVGRENREINQPNAIQSYNKYMNGVDVHDQMRKQYQCGRASKKYWKYLLWFMFDVARVNSWIIYSQVSTRQVSPKRFEQKHFILELATELIGNFSSRKQLCHRDASLTLDVIQNTQPHIHVRLPGSKRRCKRCYDEKRRYETVYGCPVCNKHLCTACFRKLH